jgi:hypothetical protein
MSGSLSGIIPSFHIPGFNDGTRLSILPFYGHRETIKQGGKEAGYNKKLFIVHTLFIATLPLFPILLLIGFTKRKRCFHTPSNEGEKKMYGEQEKFEKLPHFLCNSYFSVSPFRL